MKKLRKLIDKFICLRYVGTEKFFQQFSVIVFPQINSVFFGKSLEPVASKSIGHLSIDIIIFSHFGEQLFVCGIGNPEPAAVLVVKKCLRFDKLCLPVAIAAELKILLILRILP